MPRDRAVLDGNTHQALGIDCLWMQLPLGEDSQGPPVVTICVFLVSSPSACTRWLVTGLTLRSPSINLCCFAPWLQSSLSIYWFSLVTSQLQIRASVPRLHLQAAIKLSCSCLSASSECVCLKIGMCAWERKRAKGNTWTLRQVSPKIS